MVANLQLFAQTALRLLRVLQQSPRQVLEYFDSYLIGLTATSNKQMFGFFQQNLVRECGDERAVADGVNVSYDVYQN